MGLRAWLHALTAPTTWQDSEIRLHGEPKLICVVNHGLKMGKGKIAAQVGHAAVSATLKVSATDPARFQAWLDTGQGKVVVKAEDAVELERLAEKAKGAMIPVCEVRDAGRTQIPSGSLTVIAIGPANEELLEPVTGYLKLL